MGIPNNACWPRTEFLRRATCEQRAAQERETQHAEKPSSFSSGSAASSTCHLRDKLVLAPVGLLARELGSSAFDVTVCRSGVEVHDTQVTFQLSMRLPKKRGELGQHPTAPADQPCRLDRAVAGGSRDGSMDRIIRFSLRV